MKGLSEPATVGQIIRYGGGLTALMRVTKSHIHGGAQHYYGRQFFGGTEGRYHDQCYEATAGDIARYEEQEGKKPEVSIILGLGNEEKGTALGITGVPYVESVYPFNSGYDKGKPGGEKSVEVHHSPPKYDSAAETRHHIMRVGFFGMDIITGLLKRFRDHDQSKLGAMEKPFFDEHTPRLRNIEYGSPAYTECLAKMKPALDHHYAYNSHHPEHYKAGIQGMDLLDIVEMLADWKAATERMENGDLECSIEINQKRFGYSDDLKAIFLNTARRLGWVKQPQVTEDNET